MYPEQPTNCATVLTTKLVILNIFLYSNNVNSYLKYVYHASTIGKVSVLTTMAFYLQK